MATFKFVISEPETRKSYQLEVDQAKAIALVGKKIGDEFNGDLIGLNGYSLKITGGSDKDGFPMHPSVKGPGRKRVLLSSTPGFHPKIKGQRKRKTVRGDTISDAIVQINVKVVKKGEKPLEELVPTKPKEKKEEKKPEEAKEEKPKEEKKEEKKEEGEKAKEEK
jgi:small subunit ribosomal protein S6e